MSPRPAEIVVQCSASPPSASPTFKEDAEAEDRFAIKLMLRNGIPEEVTVTLRSVRGWGSHVTVTHPLDDGQALSLRDLTVWAAARLLSTRQSNK